MNCKGKTIAFNRVRKLTEIFSQGVNCKRFCLDSGFNGDPWDIRELYNYYVKNRGDHKLRQYRTPSGFEYHVTAHSNLWFTFEIPDSPPPVS